VKECGFSQLASDSPNLRNVKAHINAAGMTDLPPVAGRGLGDFCFFLCMVFVGAAHSFLRMLKHFVFLELGRNDDAIF